MKPFLPAHNTLFLRHKRQRPSSDSSPHQPPHPSRDRKPGEQRSHLRPPVFCRRELGRQHLLWY